jgi:hypothetical protein
MASKALSMACDSGGTPDEYVFIGPRGHIRYRNRVPGSTMPELLAATARLSDNSAGASHRRLSTSAAALP